MLRRLLLLSTLALACALALPAAVPASTSIAGTGEPIFTRTTTNTHWFGYNRFSSYGTFRLRVSYYAGAANVHNEWTGYIGSSGVALTGQAYADFAGVVNTLQHGTSYGVCVNGNYTIVGDFTEFPEANASCSNTTIDTTPPQISVSVSGTDTFTKTVPIPVQINYADDLSFPYAANFICARTGLDPSAALAACNGPGGPHYNYSDVCSVPVNGTTLASAKNNQFNCTVTDSPPLPDGPVTVCAISANSALPDVPGSSNQITPADTAGLSTAQCGYVIVDRTAPQLSFSAPDSVKVGDLVSVTGSVTDGGSGAGPSIGWTWGDNTAGSSGISPTHTYTQPGTYTITMSSADVAGNPGSATRTITVTPASTGGGTTGGGTTGGGTTGGGTATGGGGSVTQAPTAQEIAKQVGATGGATGATQKASAGALDVLTARKVKITSKLKALPLALTADTAGAAQFALIRGGRIAAKSGLNVTKPGSLGFKLKLPKRLKPGRYSLKITFTPKGAARASTKTIAITFSAAKKKPARTSRAVVAGGPVLGNVPPAVMPDGGPATAPRPGGGIHVPRR